MNVAVESEPVVAVCTGCKGKKRVWSRERQRRVDCPHCTGQGTAQAQRALTELKLTGAEHRRVAQARRMIDAAVANALLEKRNPATIASRPAAAVNRIMERWAVGHGSGLPPDDVGALKARPPRLDDPTQCVIDDIVNHSPHLIKHLICQWYRTEIPVVTMANQRGIGVRTMYGEWHSVLNWLESAFRSSKHVDLVRMLAMVDI